MRNPYEVLGVSKNASMEEITEKYCNIGCDRMKYSFNKTALSGTKIGKGCFLLIMLL